MLFSRGLPQEEEAARPSEASCCRVLRRPSAAVIPTASAVAESVTRSTLDARFGRSLHAVAPCARPAG
eukprot:1749601-Prymnesium_polylepis.1